jgi:nitrogen-specific signal transduction histidine kinase
MHNIKTFRIRQPLAASCPRFLKTGFLAILFLPSIFAPFTQAESTMRTSGGGLGLGLAISKELVDIHGGTIAAYGDGPGKGSTFVVRLPQVIPPDRTDSRSLEHSEQAASDGEVIKAAKILVVEDEEKTRDALEKLLHKEQANVSAVTTAAEAIECFQKSTPDLIISDIGLRGPVRHAGRRAFHMVRAAHMV